MQTSLEAEVRGKAEAMRAKKKLEQDINELEVALDAANRGRADADKNIKKLQQQIRELQQQVKTNLVIIQNVTHWLLVLTLRSGPSGVYTNNNNLS
jgi:phage shock protein A